MRSAAAVPACPFGRSALDTVDLARARLRNKENYARRRLYVPCGRTSAGDRRAVSARLQGTAAELRPTRLVETANGTPAVELVGAERDPGLDEAVRGLPPRRRLLVFLRYFADLSYGEIAQVCDISEGTVAATLAQARQQLLDALAEGSRP